MRSDDLPLTHAVATRLEVVTHTRSTNADLVGAIATDADAWPAGALLVTDDQRAGRGRLDRVWTTPAGEALAVSVVVSTALLPAESFGWIPLAAGAAMTRAVAAQLPEHTVRLKWPNDVLVDGRKICGILVEGARHERAVVGAGVNTAMPRPPVETATSFAVLGASVDADRLLADYATALAEHVAALDAEAGDAVRAGLHAEVSALCRTIGEEVAVSLPDGSTLRGRAIGIGVRGELQVDAEGERVAVTAGDVVHVRTA